MNCIKNSLTHKTKDGAWEQTFISMEEMRYSPKAFFYGHWSDNLFFCLCRGLPTFTHFTNFLQILAVKNPTKLPTFKQGITF